MALQQEVAGHPGKTEHPKQLFYERVSRLPGVLRVETLVGRPIAEQSFTVYVAQGDMAARNRVYDLELEIYKLREDARLDVHVQEES